MGEVRIVGAQMNLLRRTTNFLRIEPGPDAWLKQSPFGSPRAGVSPEELQPLIRALLMEASLESARAQDVIGKLRDISTKAGTFLTASEIQRCLRGFSFEDDNGEELTGTRAYELAAKFHWEHIHRQIEAIEVESRPMGPTVFATFLEEMVECLIRGDDARRAVEIPILLADSLLERILMPSLHTLEYMTLADRAVGVSLECCEDWIKKNQPPQDDAEEETEEEEKRLEYGPLSSEVMEYLAAIEPAFKHIGQELNELLSPIESSGLVAEGDPQTKTVRQNDYLQVLQSIGEQAKYAPFKAMLLESMALSARVVDEKKAGDFEHEAEVLWDALAEEAEALELSMLSSKRMSRAKRLRGEDTAQSSAA